MMYNCNECTERLLEYLYDLLDDSEAEAVRAHLSDCPLCRAEMALAEEDRQLLAKAARVYQSVAEFAPPAAQPLSLSPAPVRGDAETIVQLDTVENERPAGKPLRARLGPWLAAAAVLLIGVGLLYGWHRQELSRYERAFDAARGKVVRVNGRLANLGAELEKSRAELMGTMEKRGIELRAYGAAQYQRNIDNSIRIAVKDLSNEDAQAEITARCFFQKDKSPLTIKTKTENGQARIALPGNLPVKAGDKLRLEILAKSGDAGERIEETLAVAKPSYVTHIYTTKPAYNVGELLFFRTVTLDRFTLQPPDRQFQLSYSLLNADGKPVLQIPGVSGEGGIGGGEFALSDTKNLPDGEYTLRVEEANGSKGFQPQDVNVVIRRAESPEVVLNQSNFAPGDVIRGNITSRRSRNGAARAQEPVTVKFRLRGRNAGANTSKMRTEIEKTLQLRTDNAGNAQFELPLAKNLPPGLGELEFQFHDGVRDEKVTQVVPVVPKWKADVFPESGQLTAGVNNRLICRVTTPPVRKRELQAQLVDGKNKVLKNVRLQSAGAQREWNTYVGRVDFTPKPGNQYRLRIPTDGNKPVERALPSPEIDGAALTVDNSVADEKTPIDCRVFSKKSNRKLLVVAACRGRLIDLQLVKATPPGVKVRLHAGANVRGVARVTVYEPKPAQLKPLAERLVYRRPLGKLHLSYTPLPKGKRAYLPGERIALQIQAENERRQVAEPWVAASVVADEDFAPPSNVTASMPFFFLGCQSTSPADLEDAQIVLRDEPKAAKELDRFLAVNGCRFVPVDLSSAEAEMGRRKVQPVRPPTLFSRDNCLQLQERQKKYLERKLAELDAKTQERGRQLRADREERIRKAKSAYAALAEYRELPLRVGRIALGVLCLALFAGGALLVIVGLIRIVRRSRPATPALALAFASLLLCLLLYGGAVHLQPWLQPIEKGQANAADFSADQTPQLPPPMRNRLVGKNEELAFANPLPDTAKATRLHESTGDVVRLKAAAGAKKPTGQELVATANNAYFRNSVNLRRQPDPSAQQMTILHLQQVQRRPRFTQADNLQKQIRQLQSTLPAQDKIANKSATPSKSGPAPTRPKTKGGGKSGQGMPKPSGYLPTIPPTPNFPGSLPPITQQPVLGAVAPLDLPGQAPSFKQIAGGGFGGKSGKPGTSVTGASRKGPFGFNQLNRQPHTYYARDFFNQNLLDGSLSRDTLLWKPALRLKNGQGRVSFDLPYQPNTFRIFIQGHDAAGRFGYREGRIEVRKK